VLLHKIREEEETAMPHTYDSVFDYIGHAALGKNRRNHMWTGTITLEIVDLADDTVAYFQIRSSGVFQGINRIDQNGHAMPPGGDQRMLDYLGSNDFQWTEAYERGREPHQPRSWWIFHAKVPFPSLPIGLQDDVVHDDATTPETWMSLGMLLGAVNGHRRMDDKVELVFHMTTFFNATKMGEEDAFTVTVPSIEDGGVTIVQGTRPRACDPPGVVFSKMWLDLQLGWSLHATEDAGNGHTIWYFEGIAELTDAFPDVRAHLRRMRDARRLYPFYSTRAIVGV
jgi:hypothetical protein